VIENICFREILFVNKLLKVVLQFKYMKRKRRKVIFGLGILTFLVLIMFSFVLENRGFVPEMVFFIFLISFLYVIYDRLNLNLPIFIIFILSLVPHTLGFLGFYTVSPLPIQWDHVTHFFPLLATTLMFFNFLHKWMDKKFFSFKTISLVLIVMLAAMGIGTIIELVEFAGFLFLGFGDGGLFFGAGDACPQFINFTEQIIYSGGGWFNTMYDLIWNDIGILVGLAIMIFVYYTFPKVLGFYKMRILKKNGKSKRK